MRELCSAFAVALVACTAATDRPTPEQGRGSPTCRQWQDSVCDWSDRCEALEREHCDEQFQGATCKSDSAAESCVKAFDEASCDVAPVQCGLSVIADPAPAAAACDTVTERFCQRAVECGISASEADCQAREAVDCSRSLAYKLDYEICLDAIEAMDCQVIQLPEVCESVIILRP